MCIQSTASDCTYIIRGYLEFYLTMDSATRRRCWVKNFLFVVFLEIIERKDGKNLVILKQIFVRAHKRAIPSLKVLQATAKVR